ncbi:MULTISPECIES: hypothetical protein [Streptacidiphilus]|uniref:Uncharacterized protein n=1 Tax=Streptacidiphilus cavernicola TaxID=3342716 RepID=A0ABV6UVP3_9ACTN|nr:hypothetical protein [Streptacidiphilus jeojiense]
MDQRSKQRKRRSLWAVLTVVLTVVAGGLATALAANNAAPAAPNPNCSLIVPADPLTAQGLATPYQLAATDAGGGPCNEANANQSAFVEAAILTNNGQLTLYDPLVVDQGTQPAAAPVTPQVPAGSTVGLWFGFNGTNLTLQSANGTTALQQGNCVNGTQGSIFGQFSYCNAPAFFQSANQEIQANMLQVPAAGTANDGQPCPTVRDFSVVDQDQSDNVVTHYIATGNGTIAQNNAASKAALQNQNPVDLANGSDNLLLTQFIDPALGCTPWTRPDQSSDGAPSAALPLDELSAAANQQAPIALVPQNDPMVLNNNNQDANKTNLYRQGVDQAAIGGADSGSGATYCQNFFGSANGIQRVFKDMATFQNAPSVDAAMATNLFTFLAMRANQSFTNLNCGGLLNVANPITLTMDGNGVVTAATYTPLGQTPVAAANCTATPTAGAASTPAAAGMSASASASVAPSAAGSASASAAGSATASSAVGNAWSATGPASMAAGAGSTSASAAAPSTAAAGTAPTSAAAAAPPSASSTCTAAASAPAAGNSTGATTPASAMPTATWGGGRGMKHHHHHM